MYNVSSIEYMGSYLFCMYVDATVMKQLCWNRNGWVCPIYSIGFMWKYHWLFSNSRNSKENNVWTCFCNLLFLDIYLMEVLTWHRVILLYLTLSYFVCFCLNIKLSGFHNVSMYQTFFNWKKIYHKFYY